MSVTSDRSRRKKSGQRHQPAKVLLHLLPALPLLALLIAVLVRDAAYEPPAPTVTVVVRQHPEQKTRATLPAPPVFKASVQDDPPEFDPTFGATRPVIVTIVDEKEEHTPVPPRPVIVEIMDSGASGLVPAVPGEFATVDPRPRVIWHYGVGMRFGIGAVETRKRLTFSPDGSTNQTMLRVNGQIGEFGGPLGTFLERDTRLPANAAREVYVASKSTWVSANIIYTQVLELIPSKLPTMIEGRPTRLLDTIRVRYFIENKNIRTMTAGLRMQLDTLIGANDGVPFTVPGMRGLVTHFADFPKAGPIPDFMQALERPNLRDPGVVAQLALKLGGQTEPPTRVTLTHWPGVNYPNWDVPLAPLNGDSAVVLYWNDKPLKPGEKREMGFAYGLGNVASTDPGGTLGITLGGNFEPGEAFTVTAYAHGFKKGQTLTLDIPSGFERIDGEESQAVPPPAQGATNSIVTWKVKVLRTGTFPLKVVSSTGLSQGKTITIGRPEGTPELRLTVDVVGSFEPGQEFTVQAKVASMGQVPSATPGVTLSSGLSTREGPMVKAQAVTEQGYGNVASWKVKVLEPGTHTVRVDWCGAAITKTLKIVRPETPKGGYCSMALSPPFEPGKAFTVTATVSDPIPGQSLKLQLPPGLHLTSGQEEMPVIREKDASTVVKWQVTVDQPGTFPLQLVSSAGLTLKKTITIKRGDDKAGSFKLDYLGDIAPGKEITVRATVIDAVPGQQLTLLPLPTGLERVDDSAVKPVPSASTQPHGTSFVTWRLRVLHHGTLPVRVASTTGVVQSFTITITVELPAVSGPQIFGGR